MSNTRLTRLRDSLTELQRAVLNRLWAHMEQTGKPMSQRAFYFDFSRDESDPAIDALGGKIVIQNYVEGINCYAPTLLGALLSSKGPALEDILCRCLKFVRARYEADRELRSLTSDQLKEGGGLTRDETETLRILMSLAYHELVITGGGGAKDGPWTLSVREEVDRLRQVEDWQAYLHEEVMKGFDQAYPVSEAKRAALIQSPIGWLDGFDRLSSEASPKVAEQDELRFEFVENAALRRVLACDWNELGRVLAVKAYKSCVILCGGIIEGMLLSAVRTLTQSELQGAVRETRARNTVPEEMGIAELLKVCDCKRLIDAQRLHLGQFVRLYRNLIHPGSASEQREEVGENEATIAVLAVKSIAEAFRQSRK